MSTVRVDLHLAVIRREDRYGFAIVNPVDGTELASIGEGATPSEIREWIVGCLSENAEPFGTVLAEQFYAAYRAVKTG